MEPVGEPLLTFPNGPDAEGGAVRNRRCPRARRCLPVEPIVNEEAQPMDRLVELPSQAFPLEGSTLSLPPRFSSGSLSGEDPCNLGLAFIHSEAVLLEGSSDLGEQARSLFLEVVLRRETDEPTTIVHTRYPLRKILQGLCQN